jgi:DNA-binding NarL/FixJ family response regulator
MPAPIRVLVAEDHPVIRRGLVVLLSAENDFVVAGVAENGESAVGLAWALAPDVAVLDINMPIIDGIEAGRQILGHLPQTKLLMVSAEQDPLSVDKALAIGASGFISKNFSSAHVARAIRDIVRGKTYLALTPEK